jgi:hypothetical protein
MPVISYHLFLTWLLPVLEDELGELDEQHRQFVSVCELCAPQDHMASSQAATYHRRFTRR